MSQVYLVGRDEGCTIRVNDDDYVSGRHAVLRQDDDGSVWVADLGSMNGTYIQRGGLKTRVYGPTLLLPGDVLWLGGRTRIPWTKEGTVGA